MSFASDLEAEVKAIFGDRWSARNGVEVPEPEDLGMGNVGVKLDATVLYADLDGSTAMVETQSPEFAGEIYKAYLRCCAKIIRLRGGVITAYDGDRVMGIFIGNHKSTAAAECALNINHTVLKIINPALRVQYPKSTFEVKHVVGIDTSTIMATRTGVRGDNDLVWVGRAANYAAKLTSLSEFPSWITKAVYDVMNKSSKISNDGRDMWERRYWTAKNNMEIYCSSWSWEPK